MYKIISYKSKKFKYNDLLRVIIKSKLNIYIFLSYKFYKSVSLMIK